MSLRTVRTSTLALVLAISLLPVWTAFSQRSTPLSAGPTATYVVRPGDTLFSIAARYHTNVATLAQLNGIVNPTMIYIGQSLTVPALVSLPSATATSTPAGDMVYTVQPGETLYRIAVRYGTTAWTLAAYNKLDSPSVIYAGQRLMIPSGSKNSATVPALPSLPDPFVSVDVAPLPVIQGNSIAVTVLTSRAVSLNGAFLDWAIPFVQEGNAYHGLIGIHAMQKVGLFPMTITATDSAGKRTTMTTSVQVGAGKFAYETINLPPDRQALLAPELVNTERDKLYKIFSTFTPSRYWMGLFILPTTGSVSSAFGSRRAYAGGVFASYHEGTDFSGTTGVPIHAPADGVVALAQLLTVRGNAVIIDHGWGIFSGLYHMSEIDVIVGQRVTQGQVVGKIGGTGLATGPHLHWDLRVRGLNVDPMQWTRRVFP